MVVSKVSVAVVSVKALLSLARPIGGEKGVMGGTIVTIVVSGKGVVARPTALVEG